jgi:hypothetical protein
MTAETERLIRELGAGIHARAAYGVPACSAAT